MITKGLSTIGNPHAESGATGYMYLVLHDRAPLLLGEGKFARVYLGATRDLSSRAEPPQIGEFVALKFLKRDKASTAVTRNALYRFCQEVNATAKAYAQGLKDEVVEMYGYGRIDVLPSVGTDDRDAMEQAFGHSFASGAPAAEPHRLFGTKSAVDLDELFRGNRTQFEECGIELEDLTGDFYALQLCLMSLEEVLLSRGDPYGTSSGRALQTIELTTAPLLAQRAQDNDKLEKRGLSLSSTATGFEDLTMIARWLEDRRDENELRGARFPSAVFFQLWSDCLQMVKVMHEVPSDDAIGIAHRDIKPANVLVMMGTNLNLRLSDLGFLASVGEIAKGNFTRVSSIDEGGVLPTGSKGFRAPEQIESGDEVAFAPLMPGDSSISLFAYLDSVVDTGDWLRIGGEFTNESSVTRLRVIDAREQSTRCEFSHAFVKPHGVSKGRLIKDVALHSDVYALGCLAYFLGSEGRNPERFMRQYLDEVVMRSFSTSLPSWVLGSPLWLSAVLCRDEPETIAADLKALIIGTSESQQSALDGSAQGFKPHFKTILSALSPRGRWLGEARSIASFRRGIATSTSLGDLLVGRESQQPIAFPLLAMTILCCLRDRAGSFVKRDVTASTRDELQQDELAVYSRHAPTFARDIVGIADRLGKAPSVSGHWASLADFGGTARLQFMRVRLAGNRPRAS